MPTRRPQYTYAAAHPTTVTYASAPVSYDATTQPAMSYSAPPSYEATAQEEVAAGADYSYGAPPEQTYMAYGQAPETGAMSYAAAPAVYSGVPTMHTMAPTIAPAPFPAPLLAAPSMVATPNQDWFNGQGQFKFYADPPSAAGAAETEAPAATRDVTVQKKYKKRGCC